VSATQLATTSVEQLGSGGIYTTAVTIEAPAPGFLCVKVMTDKLLKEQKGLTVKFYPSDTSGAIKGDQIGPDATTDDKGVAGVDRRLAPGYFACVVDGMTVRVRPIDVDTFAEASANPYPLGLPRGFLAAKLLFRNLPLKDFKVRFFEVGDDGSKKGPALGTAPGADKGLPADKAGTVALVGDEFKLGNYLCEVEGKWVAAVSTVEDIARPYVLSLPLARPLMAYQEPGRVEGGADVPEQPESSAGYLAVKVLFRGLPLMGANVTFYQSGPDGKPLTGEGSAGGALTDNEGVATLEQRAALGNYFCLVEGQSAYASVSTVEDRKQPYVILLPVGRPMLTVRQPGRLEPVVSEVAERPASAGSYLSVMVLFRNLPVVGRKVQFFASTQSGTADLTQPKGEAITDNLGIATMDATASLGAYFCQVEGQTGYFSIGTVEDKDLPYVVNLPQGRPFLALVKPGAISGLKDAEERDPPEEKP
jgi:hypothetical protein